MTVIETKGEVDNSGQLKLKHPLKIQNKEVRVVIQVIGNIEKKEEKKNKKAEANNKIIRNEKHHDFQESDVDDFELEDEEENEDSFSNF